MSDARARVGPPSADALTLILLLSASATILLVGWVMTYAAFGLDFTDEGFYLNWVSNPWLYGASVTQFGYVYHPLYELLGGDVAALRRVNVLITLGLSMALCHASLSRRVPEDPRKGGSLWIVSAGLATASLSSLEWWLLTPSYNSLALQALLLAATGLMLCDGTGSRASVAGWALLGVGGWLAFMAKPTTALALAVVVMLYLWLAGKFVLRWVGLCMAIALALVWTSALAIDGSLAGFVQRLRLGFEYSSLLGGGHTVERILRVDRFRLGTREGVAIAVFASASLATTWLALRPSRWARAGGLLVSLLACLVIAALSLGFIHRPAGFTQFQGLVLLGLALIAAAIGVVGGRTAAGASRPAGRWAAATVFFLLPHVYAFGTNGNYWAVGGWAAIFWLLGGWALLSGWVHRQGRRVAAPLVLVAQAAVALLVQTGVEVPYRQPHALRLNDTPVVVGRSSLVLPAGYARYTEDAKAAARQAGLVPGTPMIDLSGQSPAILFALEAQAIGQAWTIGAYPGSLALATANLRRAPCEAIAQAWLLVEPDGPRSIPLRLMADLGARFPAHYRAVGEWATAEGAGGYAQTRRQVLYAPSAPAETLQHCRALRPGDAP